MRTPLSPAIWRPLLVGGLCLCAHGLAPHVAASSTSLSQTIVETVPLSATVPVWRGPLAAGQGGLGSDLWAGTRAFDLERSLSAITLSERSASLRDIAMRLLLTDAEPPSGANDPRLAVERVRLLVQLGERWGAVRVADLVPQLADEPDARRMRAESLLLLRDADAACASVGEDLERFAPRLDRDSRNAWLQLRAACAAIVRDGSALDAAIAAHAGPMEPTLRAMLLRVAGRSTARAGDAVPSDRWRSSPLVLALALVGPSALPASAVPASSLDGADLSALLAIHENQASDPALRAAAAEQAGHAGAINAETLSASYARIPFSDGQIARASAEAARMDPVRARALLVRAIDRTSEPVSLWGALLRRSADVPAGSGVLSLIAERSATLRPNEDTAPIAPLMARALYMAGERARPVAWHRLALDSTGDGPLALPVGRLAPLAAAAMAIEQPGGSEALDAWRAVEVETAGGSARVAAIDEILAALRADAPPLETGRGGEVLRALAALGSAGPISTAPDIVAGAILGLRRAGLSEEARRVAVEAVAGRLI